MIAALPPARLGAMDDGAILTVVVEIPKGSRNKYEMDHETGEIFLDRMLFTSMQYPADYGFIDGTLGGDGDPLDALVFVGEPTFPGCRIQVRPVGLFRMTDEKGEDEKILCVPLRDPMWSHVGDIDGMPLPLLNEIEHFFQVYKDLEGHKVATDGFEDRASATRVIAEARARRDAHVTIARSSAWPACPPASSGAPTVPTSSDGARAQSRRCIGPGCRRRADTDQAFAACPSARRPSESLLVCRIDDGAIGRRLQPVARSSTGPSAAPTSATTRSRRTRARVHARGPGARAPTRRSARWGCTGSRPTSSPRTRLPSPWCAARASGGRDSRLGT